MGAQARQPIKLSNQHIGEFELVQKLRIKDPSALEYLYDHYSAALYGVVIRIVKNEGMAEEVMQDVFLRIWNHFTSYDPDKGKLFTWMINIARNQAIDKARSKEKTKNDKTRGLENVVDRINKTGFAEMGEDGIGVRELLNVLPEDQRFVVDHLYLKGYTQRELSDEFNIPLGTVKTRLRMAMQQLKNISGIL